MDRLLIVDGSNLLFQMFFGMPARIFGKNGRAIHGTVGFIGALIKITKKASPTHLLVVFDAEGHNPRVDIDPEYKASRPDYSEVADDENPFTQLPDIYRALDYMGIKRYETVSEEADDVIAAYCRALTDTEIVISSFDSDFFQLVCERVRVLRYRGDNTVICDARYVYEHVGVYPECYAEYKALVGDKADNIKGISGVGPKTAAALINEYGSISHLVESVESIKRPKLRQAIEQQRDRLYKNCELIRLSGNCTVPYALDALRYSLVGYTTREVISAIDI